MKSGAGVQGCEATHDLARLVELHFDMHIILADDNDLPGVGGSLEELGPGEGLEVEVLEEHVEERCDSLIARWTAKARKQQKAERKQGGGKACSADRALL